MIRFILSIILSVSIQSSILPQIFSEEDIEICNSKFQIAVKNNLTEKPINEVIIEIGKSFIGTEYLSHGLEKEGDEQLVINLTGLDCTTFVENVLALSRCVKKGKTSFENYLRELQLIRYRDGEINQYPSRLHYFSDWIFSNESKGLVDDVTKEIGGVPIHFDVNFMSTHPGSYMQLKDNPEFIPIIQNHEKEISERKYFFIPKKDAASIEDEIESGDLIAITTTVDGLDIGHTGIAIKIDDGRIHLLHAPKENTKVQISENPLPEYLMAIKHDSGIIVLKPLEP